VSVAGLLLGDSRFPAGGHAHSGGVEPAITAGTVRDLETLEVFLRGRLRTAGLVAAAIAACACEHAWLSESMKYPQCRGASAPDAPDGTASPWAGPEGASAGGQDGGTGGRDAPASGDWSWDDLDAEVDARTPSAAQREASRRQGRALLRAARVAWPEATGLLDIAAGARAGPGAAGPGSRRVTSGGGRREYRGGPHHAIVLGAAAAAAGAEPGEAARIAAYQAVAGPVSAAVRLLALDPMRATGVLARLAREIDQVAGLGTACAGGPPADLPSASAPALDLLAEAHIRAEVRLFES
jgi:urease accessory protein